MKSLLLGLTLKRWNKNFGDVEKLVWEKSLGTSAAAAILAGFFGKKYVEAAQLCGLLHNLGQIIMLSNPKVRSDYPRVLDYIRENRVDFDEAEREVIGYSHALVGAMVAHKWQLPLAICTTILRYPQPFDGIDNAQDEQIALVKISAALAMGTGLGCPAGHPIPGEELHVLATALGFKEKDFGLYRSALAKQVLALYTAESHTFN